MKPIISVVIAVYNGSKFISETLDSIIAQTYNNWECIIVDDGSTDATCEIVEEYIKRDNRIKLIKTSGGNGPYKAANIGIKEAQGEYIARSDADDISMPNRLGLQINILSRNKEFKICATEHFNLFEDGSLVRKTIVQGLNNLKYYLIFKNPILHSSLFVEKKWFEEIGMYPEKSVAQDYFIWCKSLLLDKLIVIHEPLLYWRIHSNSITKVESVKQGEFTLEINKWYISSLLNLEVKLVNSEILFGSFRGLNIEKKDYKTMSETIKLLFKIESKLLYNNELKRLKNQFLYVIESTNSEKKIDLFKLNFLIIIDDFTFLFRPLIYKIMFKNILRQ